MSAFVSWVDYSSAERQRMRQAVALFKESSTRDELGLGGIRDAIADVLFPGTSTIQTRIAYALFVPWIYVELEGDHRVHAGNVEARGRLQETALIAAFDKSADSTGLIGGRAGAALQRLPSRVYWSTLTRWGIFRLPGSIDEYHLRWDSIRQRKTRALRTDDAGIPPEALATWHPALPGAPDGFPNEASFQLRPEDATFLQDRILEACQGSLLRHALLPHENPPDLDCETPWEAFPDLPPPLADHVRVGRRFSWLMQGAAFVYNLALARMDRGREELADDLEQALAAWAEHAQREGVVEWELDELWRFCDGRVQLRQTKDFVTRWQELLRSNGSRAIGASADARSLIEARERSLKPSDRSRFQNPRARELWSGNSGTALMTYRWRTAQRFLQDLLSAREDG